MANNPSEAASDDFLESILGYPSYGTTGDNNLGGNDAAPAAMMLQLGSSDGSPHLGVMGAAGLGVGIGSGYGVAPGSGTGGFLLGLSLEQGKTGFGDASGSGNRFLRDDRVDSRGSASSVKPSFHAQPMANTAPPAVPHLPQMRPRVRARRGQATDPHSIAERLRRERIAEKIRALQELVPNVNKTDRAAMLDEIMDYVKFLRLQVKVLSMSRLGGAGAVAPLVMDIPISSLEDEGNDGGRQPAWEKWSNDGTEREVAKLMEENTGAALQFLQSKGLCIMPISLASAIYRTQPPETSSITKPSQTRFRDRLNPG